MTQLFIDTNKVGTLILGYYRTGSHFLHDLIIDTANIPTTGYWEICDDNTADQLKIITAQSAAYKVCILNNFSSKFYITSDLLKNWHVIHLTRNDKVGHFISDWVWKQNTQQERITGTGKFKHHGTSSDTFEKLKTNKITVNIDSVITWLSEELINYKLPHNYVIDYSDLKNYQSDYIKWNPNQYNFQLADIFENFEEIETLLKNFNK